MKIKNRSPSLCEDILEYIGLIEKNRTRYSYSYRVRIAFADYLIASNSM